MHFTIKIYFIAYFLFQLRQSREKFLFATFADAFSYKSFFK